MDQEHRQDIDHGNSQDSRKGVVKPFFFNKFFIPLHSPLIVRFFPATLRYACSLAGIPVLVILYLTSLF